MTGLAGLLFVGIALVVWGFVGNRLFEYYHREAQFLVEEGAKPEEVDAALVGFGMETATKFRFIFTKVSLPAGLWQF